MGADPAGWLATTGTAALLRGARVDLHGMGDGSQSVGKMARLVNELRQALRDAYRAHVFVTPVAAARK